VALGDSSAAGAPGAARPVRFPDALAAELRCANGALEYRNLGVAGALTEEVADGQLGRCIQLEPDLVTVICGANDVLLSTRPDINAHAESLEYLLGTLASELPGVALVTATTPDVSGFIEWRPRSRRRVARGLRELNEATRAAARRRGALLLDFAQHPQSSERGNFAHDGYHPSPDGVRRAARRAALALEAHYGIAAAREKR
jgi:phosphatidylinositol alpha 1,6-mannosyltransferase